ncbi:MAG: hypothetical protein ABH835_01640 [Patescibacteria group bacterium]|nr:hypothetical protein [Patescibacteria group bacterium]
MIQAEKNRQIGFHPEKSKNMEIIAEAHDEIAGFFEDHKHYLAGIYQKNPPGIRDVEIINYLGRKLKDTVALKNLENQAQVSGAWYWIREWLNEFQSQNDLSKITPAGEKEKPKEDFRDSLRNRLFKKIHEIKTKTKNFSYLSLGEQKEVIKEKLEDEIEQYFRENPDKEKLMTDPQREEFLNKTMKEYYVIIGWH